jgi:hypothetical protein
MQIETYSHHDQGFVKDMIITHLIRKVARLGIPLFQD